MRDPELALVARGEDAEGDHAGAVDVDQPHLVETVLLAERTGLHAQGERVVGPYGAGNASGRIAVERGQVGGRHHGARIGAGVHRLRSLGAVGQSAQAEARDQGDPGGEAGGPGGDRAS